MSDFFSFNKFDCLTQQEDVDINKKLNCINNMFDMLNVNENIMNDNMMYANVHILDVIRDVNKIDYNECIEYLDSYLGMERIENHEVREYLDMIDVLNKNDNDNKDNDLCSGYFCSFINPPTYGRYKKMLCNNASKYNNKYIFDLYRKTYGIVKEHFNKKDDYYYKKVRGYNDNIRYSLDMIDVLNKNDNLCSGYSYSSI